MHPHTRVYMEDLILTSTIFVGSVLEKPGAWQVLMEISCLLVWHTLVWKSSLRCSWTCGRVGRCGAPASADEHGRPNKIICIHLVTCFQAHGWCCVFSSTFWKGRLNRSLQNDEWNPHLLTYSSCGFVTRRTKESCKTSLCSVYAVSRQEFWDL